MNKRLLVLPLLLLFSYLLVAQTRFSLLPKKGLYIQTAGLNWASGSEVSFFTPDKKHHHYYFTWWDQDVDSTAQGKVALVIGSSNTAVDGYYSLQQLGQAGATTIACRWNLQEDGVADVVYAKIWQPFLADAKWYGPNREAIGQLTSFHDTLLFMVSPFGSFRFHASNAFRVKLDVQPNPGEKDYTRRAQNILLYENDIPVTKATGLQRAFTVEQEGSKALEPGTTKVLDIPLQPFADAWKPASQQPLMLPLPKSMDLKDGYYMLPANKPDAAPGVANQYRNLLKLQWQIGEQYYPKIIATQNTSLAAEGYRMQVSTHGVQLEYKTPQGLQHAMHTLVQLTTFYNGQLAIPLGTIDDEPKASWRGIHMFTGPASWPLHRRMYDRVLLPLKMNKVVLQCEQAQWKSRSEVWNNISVPLADLKAEFDYLRNKQVEPIPLIQSLGHMEWFFKPKQNRRFAVNPQYPYTLNPEIPQAQAAVKAIWDEAFALLKPRVMHVGFDEIGMIGFNLPRQREIDFWKKQIAYLDNYAKRKGATLMLWGDMGLAPGEGPDACNGLTAERAATLRSTIPRGSYVADWHYLNNPDPEVYRKPLQIWKKNGNKPLASPWLWPNNVRGFALAAISERAGVLQTTWADFESSEQNMLLNMEQFGAYVLALDYAWSGRSQLPANLPYDAVEQWAGRFYSQPKPVTNKKGFLVAESLQFSNITRTAEQGLPETMSMRLPALHSSGLRLQATTTNILPEGTPVAQLSLYYKGKMVYQTQLRYGVELRSKTDRRAIYAYTPGKEKNMLYRFFEKPAQADRIVLQSLHPGAGLTVAQLILIE